jgi:hypothetical protein
VTGSENEPEAAAAEPVEIHVAGVGAVRGIRFPGADRAIILLHAPGGDLDDWQDLPSFLAGSRTAAVLAVDLPGSGLSDDAAGPWSASGVLAALGADLGLPPSRCVVVAAGNTALDLLAADPAPPLAGLVAIAPPEAGDLPRSPRLPKLVLASAADPDLLQQTRALANRLGGWAIVSAITPGADDPWLLSGTWGVHVREQIAAFARDCLGRISG